MNNLENLSKKISEDLKISSQYDKTGRKIVVEKNLNVNTILLNDVILFIKCLFLKKYEGKTPIEIMFVTSEMEGVIKSIIGYWDLDSPYLKDQVEDVIECLLKISE